VRTTRMSHVRWLAGDVRRRRRCEGTDVLNTEGSSAGTRYASSRARSSGVRGSDPLRTHREFTTVGRIVTSHQSCDPLLCHQKSLASSTRSRFVWFRRTKSRATDGL